MSDSELGKGREEEKTLTNLYDCVVFVETRLVVCWGICKPVQLGGHQDEKSGTTGTDE